MAKKNRSKGGKHQNSGPASTSNNTNSSQATNAKAMSEEDAKLLELAKTTLAGIQPDLNTFRELMELEYMEEIGKKKKAAEEEVEKFRIAREQEIEKELKEKNKDLHEENGKLAKNCKEMERSISSIQKKIDQLEEKQKKAIADAETEAEKIINEAKEEAKKENEKAIEEIEKRKEELDDRDEDIEDKQLELESKEKALALKEKRINKQAEIYDTANPDAVSALERKLQMRAEQLESIQIEYESAQRELNKIKISQIHAEGVSPEELQRTNEILSAQVEELENKCSRYTDYELSEMKRALDQEAGYLVQIKNLNNEVAERKAELVRLNNGIYEYEQLKSQMDLLRTLNEHLIDIDETAASGDSYNRYEERISNKNEGRIKTLYEVISHVKKYAASREKPLFYSDKDLRAFVAGMASSPLAILQGMSGTGKTSLPKIFCEALLGEISVVPVESSWRDRNELLGYYNDFSKKFTAKQFTCDLYKAGCERYNNTVYFIVLDEMNLSRVEYYFADFLSVLEDKKDKWLIKLVDTDMRQLPSEITDDVLKALKKDQSEEAQELIEVVNKLYPDNKLDESEDMAVTGNDKLRLITYLSNKRFTNKAKTRNLVGGPQNLLNGNTIQIPKNVWFVGTANKDESTFEITDKVYDRAQVLNFNDRAKGTRLDVDVQPVYLTFEEINKMFTKAVSEKSNGFRAENNVLLQEIEQVLKTNFRISYGNRIQDQMNIFVTTYIAAGEKGKMDDADRQRLENEAIDYQLTNKVLRKLEYEEINKEAAEKLRKIFERNGLELAKEFINWKTRGEE